MADFPTWFTNIGGWLNPSVGITEFPGMGRGAVAIDFIQVSILESCDTPCTAAYRLSDSVKILLERIYIVHNSS